MSISPASINPSVITTVSSLAGRILMIVAMFSTLIVAWALPARAAYSWTQLGAGVPSARWGMPMAADPSDALIVMFGGCRATTEYVNPNGVPTTGPDIPCLTDTYYPCPPPPVPCSYPVRTIQETWLWNGTTWSAWDQPQETRPRPSARVGASMTYDSRAGGIVLFGGLEVYSSSSWSLVADTWLYKAARPTTPEGSATTPIPLDDGLC